MLAELFLPLLDCAGFHDANLAAESRRIFVDTLLVED